MRRTARGRGWGRLGGVLGLLWALSSAPPWRSRGAAVETVPGMPPVPDPGNLYSEAGAGKLSPAVAGALPASTCRT